MTAKNIIKRWEALTSCQDYTNHRTLAQDVASLFLPRRSNIQTEKAAGTDVGWYDHIYDSTPINAAQILATGQFDLLFSGKWFEAESPNPNADFEVKVAYAEAGKRMMEVLRSSNFELEMQEFLVDRSTIHTSLMLIEEDDDDVIFCTHIPAAEYSIAEDYKKRVDTVYRCYKLTARQAVQKFGEENLGEKVLEAARNEQKQDEEFTFIHAIEPRKMRKADSPAAKDKPWASINVCKEDEKTVSEGGYDEQCFISSRYDRWGRSPYGTGPSHVELSTARGLQKMRQTILALGDRVTSPGLFVSTRQEGDINPFGVTVVDDQDAALNLPREWQSRSEYNVSKDVVDDERRRLEESFLVPLFKLLTSDHEQNREKTAYEVSKMLDEQVGRAAPTFKRLTVEVLEKLLNRVFAIMVRKGLFNDIIQNMVITDAEGQAVGIQTPKINFTSKLALAFKAVENNALVAFQSVMAGVIQLNPEVLDNLNQDKSFRRTWENLGLPLEDLHSPEEVQAKRDERMQMQQMMAAVEAAPQLGKAAKDFSAA